MGTFGDLRRLTVSDRPPSTPQTTRQVRRQYPGTVCVPTLTTARESSGAQGRRVTAWARLGRASLTPPGPSSWTSFLLCGPRPESPGNRPPQRRGGRATVPKTHTAQRRPTPEGSLPDHPPCGRGQRGPTPTKRLCFARGHDGSGVKEGVTEADGPRGTTTAPYPGILTSPAPPRALDSWCPTRPLHRGRTLFSSSTTGPTETPPESRWGWTGWYRVTLSDPSTPSHPPGPQHPNSTRRRVQMGHQGRRRRRLLETGARTVQSTDEKDRGAQGCLGWSYPQERSLHTDRKTHTRRSLVTVVTPRTRPSSGVDTSSRPNMTSLHCCVAFRLSPRSSRLRTGSNTTQGRPLVVSRLSRTIGDR